MPSTSSERSVPLPPPGPAGTRLPNAEEVRALQWLFEVEEEGYGPLTRAAMAAFQTRYDIPVDGEVMIGPRTWAKVIEAYLAKARDAIAWKVPADSMQLSGESAQEEWLRAQLEELNRANVPRAAQYYVRNRQIGEMKRAENPPTSPVPLRPVTDPEVQEAAARLTWNQSKIDRLWQAARQFGLDPRVMLAVVLQEGTGSFNTNAEVPAQFWSKESGAYFEGGSGAQPDFELDLARAMEHHIMAKVRAFSHYACGFKAVVKSHGLGDGNLFQYVNYNVPWFKEAGWTVDPGCYATHTEWWRGLQGNFDALVMPGATQAYSTYLANHPIEVPAQPPEVTFIRTNGGTGATEEIRDQPWIEAR